MDCLTRWWGSALILSVLVHACSFSDVDVDRRACPCIAGYRCNTAANVCEPADELPDAALDAGLDASPDVDIPDRSIDVIDDASLDTDAMVDAEVDDADSAVRPCDGVSALLCEDFEDPTLSSSYLVRKSLTDVVELSPMAHTGSQSLKITNVVGNSFSEIVFDSVLPPRTEETWVRAWFYLPNDEEGIAILDLKGQNGSYTVYTEGPPYSSLGSNGYTPEALKIFGSGIPTEEWFCLEMRVNYEGPRYVQTYVNSLLTAFTEMTLEEVLTDMDIGVVYRDPENPEVTMYLDDVVVSNTRIGCN